MLTSAFLKAAGGWIGGVLAACVLLSGMVSGSPSDASALTGAHCKEVPSTQAFSRWGDTNPDALEAAGRRSGGASLSFGTQTLSLTGSPGKRPLLVPNGAKAASPLQCVGTANRTSTTSTWTRG